MEGGQRRSAHKYGGRQMGAEGWRGSCCGVDGWRWGGVFGALPLAIILLSLGDRLINVAFLQLTSKGHRNSGYSASPIRCCTGGGNGHRIRSPRGFSPASPPFSPAILLWNLPLSLYCSP